MSYVNFSDIIRNVTNNTTVLVQFLVLVMHTENRKYLHYRK